MLEYQSYLNGVSPKKLIVYLHGYNDSPKNYHDIVRNFNKYLIDSVLVVPQSPQKCDHDINNLQWFGMLDVDEANKRRNYDIPTNEIFDIYEKIGERISLCAKKVNEFVSQIQQKFGIDDEHTYVAGFSQGAMLSIYVALSRKEQIAGVFCLSGLVAAKGYLEKELKSYPNTYLFHGEDDMKVQYKTLDWTIDWLKQHNIAVSVERIKNLRHRVTEEEIYKICEIINKD